MKSAMESRIAKLEEAERSGRVVFVQTILADGSIKPLRPGERYAPYVASMPEVCATTEEWLAGVQADLASGRLRTAKGAARS